MDPMVHKSKKKQRGTSKLSKWSLNTNISNYIETECHVVHHPKNNKKKTQDRCFVEDFFLFYRDSVCFFLFAHLDFQIYIYIYVSRIAWVRGQNHPYFSNNYSVYIPGKDKHILLAILRCW